MIGGGVVLLIGVGFLLWAINGMRRSRGPRRKSPKPPKELRKRYKPPMTRKPRRKRPRSSSARPAVAVPRRAA